MAVKKIPDGYQAVTPYLVIKGASAAIDYYKKVFGATERMRMDGPGGTIGHAELVIGGATLMLADEHPDFGAVSPQTFGGSAMRLHLYVEDVDAFIQRAVAAGATLLRPARNEFYGDRVAMIADPFGYSWFIATRREEMSPDEMQRRWRAVFETS